LQDFANVTMSDECEQANINQDFCKQFAAAKVLTRSQCPGGADSPCVRAHELIATMDSFFVINLLDMIVVCLCIFPVTGLICFKKKPSDKNEIENFVHFFLGFFYLIDLGFQVTALVFAFGTANNTTEKLLAAACMNDIGNYALVEFREGLKTIRILGIIELAVGAFGFGLDAILVFDKEPERLLLVHVLEVGVSVTDTFLSSIEFIKFTLEAQDKANNIFGAMAGGGIGDIKWCIASVIVGNGSCWAGSNGPDCAVHTADGMPTGMPTVWLAIFITCLSCCFFCTICAVAGIHWGRKDAICKKAIRKKAAHEEAVHKEQICEIVQWWLKLQNDA